MIDIDVSVEPIKVPCYLLLCQSCQMEEKIIERNKKLKNVLRRNLIQRIKFMIR
jgi:hypothetical protein